MTAATPTEGARVPDPTPERRELEAFCRDHHPRLVGLLALQVGDRAVAEELAQDALARLCQHWSRVRGMASPGGWLSRVAVNLANSWWRRRYAERRANARHGPDDDVHREDTASTVAVRRAVAALPTRQRTALVLRYYAELPATEVAEHMGCAPGTVRSLTHRAISNLRERTTLVDFEEATSEV